MSRSLWYITVRSFVNKAKRAVKKPGTYVGAVLVVFYVWLIVAGVGGMIADFGMATPEGLAALLSLLMFYTQPMTIIQYAKRKGIIFKKSDVHFVFVAPENPKVVLLRSGIRNFLMNFLMGAAIIIIGVFVCNIAPARLVAYGLFLMVIENLLEMALMIACYGNEVLPDQLFVVLKWILYGLMIAFVVVALLMFWQKGLSFATLNSYLTSPVIQLIPMFGWQLAVLQLIFVGPTVLNVICSLLYLVMTIALVIYAWKVKCTGEYYEDAMSFAEDYSVKLERAKKGENALNMKKKLKRNVSVQYKGNYAKAIFYRQLLEYKKNKLFIFSFQSLFFLLVGAVLCFVGVQTMDEPNFWGVGKIFILPALMAYFVLMFSGYATKWEKELENPYTFLIPDTAFHKMWNATKIEHIRAFVDGCLISIPAGIGLQLSPIFVILSVFLYVCLNANKLYLGMSADVLIGRNFGSFGRTMVRSLSQCIAIVVAMIPTIFLGLVVSINVGYACMVLVIALFTLGAAALSSSLFGKMERLD
ncbi:MAG: putative ABC exporter domain-containing protein [Roseburia sp.]